MYSTRHSEVHVLSPLGETGTLFQRRATNFGRPLSAGLFRRAAVFGCYGGFNKRLLAHPPGLR